MTWNFGQKSIMNAKSLSFQGPPCGLFLCPHQCQNLSYALPNDQNPLNYHITRSELLAKIQALQLRKASGPDCSLNEMLKFSDHTFNIAIIKLFNFILSIGHFPDLWGEGIIRPIFKKRNKFDPNSNRGICVSRNLGKLLCSILNSRLQDFLREHNVLNKHQIGFQIFFTK